MKSRQIPKNDAVTAAQLVVAVASERARRATGDATATSAPIGAPLNVEVVARAGRRRFNESDKQRILQAADRCTKPGELGAMLRSEGVYSSSLSTWRRQRDSAQRAALSPRKRGPKVDLLARSEALRIQQLTGERDRLKIELEKAHLVIEVQKKVSALLGLTMPQSATGPRS